jgi:hypothetical protein
VAVRCFSYELQLQQQLSDAQAAVDATTATATAATITTATTAADGTGGSVACVDTVTAAAVAVHKSKHTALPEQRSKVCDTPFSINEDIDQLAQCTLSAA